jgi:uncharacterized membrane protein
MKGVTTMDRMLVVVFDNEADAYEGKRALIQLDSDATISLYGYAVVTKNADGRAMIKQGDDIGPVGTLVGTTIGSLIGALFGPIGLAVGASAGLASGISADLYNSGVGDDFVEDVSKQLSPSKAALVAEIEEDWTTPVDTRMEGSGGTIFRRALSEVQHQVHEGNINAMKADLAQFKASRRRRMPTAKASSRKKSPSSIRRSKLSCRRPRRDAPPRSLNHRRRPRCLRQRP